MLSDWLREVVKSGAVGDRLPGLTAEQAAMLMVWYGTRQQVREAADVVAKHLRPQIGQDVPLQWITDAVLFAAGYRDMMESIPGVAAEQLISINGCSPAWRVMWQVERLVKLSVADPAWAAARAAWRA